MKKKVQKNLGPLSDVPTSPRPSFPGKSEVASATWELFLVGLIERWEKHMEALQAAIATLQASIGALQASIEKIPAQPDLSGVTASVQAATKSVDDLTTQVNTLVPPAPPAS